MGIHDWVELIHPIAQRYPPKSKLTFSPRIQQGLQAACSHVQPYVNVMIMILLFTSAQYGQLYHTMLQWHNVSNSKGYLYVEFS